MIVTSAAEMRALDAWTIAHGTPGDVLMERAGAGATAVLRRHRSWRVGPAVILCGKGNNGGDGFVVARHLRAGHQDVAVWLVGRRTELRGDAAHMAARWDGPTSEIVDGAQLPALETALAQSVVIVDALLGTGLDKPVTGLMAAVIAAVNAAGRPILAIDVPSGLSADTGRPLGVAVRATATATFAFPKLGLVLEPGATLAGAVEVVDIGIPAEALAALPPRARLTVPADVRAALPARAAEGHKGTYGHVLVIAGSRGKSGAALLAAEACTRTGAGLTTLAVPAALQAAVEGHVREAMTAALPDDPDGTAAAGDGTAVRQLLEGRRAVVCGPGLGLTDGSRALVAQVVRACEVPLVLDADGLNAVAGTPLLRERPAPTIVTPHPGEMSRLLDEPITTIQADRPAAVRRLAARDGVIVVLKGARTVVAHPDGRLAVNPTGNPGMASGGMGDALSGILGALLGQGLDPWDAATVGVYLHGAAADREAAARGMVGLVASDVVRAIRPTLGVLQGTVVGGDVADR